MAEAGDTAGVHECLESATSSITAARHITLDEVCPVVLAIKTHRTTKFPNIRFSTHLGLHSFAFDLRKYVCIYCGC